VYEQFYKSPIPASTVIQMAETLPDHVLNRVAPGQVLAAPKSSLTRIPIVVNAQRSRLVSRLVSGWPDAVTFTKTLSEQIVQSAARELPVCVVRPGFGMALTVFHIY